MAFVDFSFINHCVLSHFRQTSVDAATCTTDVQEDIPATTTNQATEFTSAPLTPESATVTRPLSPLSTTTPGQNAEIQPTEPDFLVSPWTPDLSHFDTEETTPQAISEDPVVECGATLSGLTQPMDDTERGALYDELYILRKEKEDLKGKISELENQLENVKLSASTVEGDDDKCKFYTGLSWDVFMTVFTYLSGFTRPSGSPVPMRDQLFLTLVKLRLDLPFEFMGTHAGVSKVRMGQIFWTWIDLMAEKMDFLVHWPDRETLTQTLPGIFKEKFPRLTCIIDCFEIFIDRPANLLARAQSYSNYKKHSTVKVFLGCTPLGSVSFLSAAWGGRVSDVELVRESGFIDPKFHLPGDQILADRGFTLQDDFAAACGAELIIPAFTKGRSQLSAQEVEVSRKISSVRIHVERVIGLLKNRYTILQGTLQIQVIKSLTDEVSEMARIDKLLRVCAGLTNLGEGIVYSESFSDEDEEEEVENTS